MLRVRAFVAFVVLLVGFSASAGTFIIPDDEVLIRRASGIVSATVLESRSELTPEGGVRTVTQLWVDRVLAGEFLPGQLVDIVEPGGETPTLSLLLHGVPRFTAGERVLLLLTKNGRGELTTLEFALGKFSYRKNELGVEYLLRDEGNICGWAPEFKPYRERARRADGFLRHIADLVAGKAGEPSYSEDYDQVCVSTAVQPITASPEAAIDYSFCDCRWSIFTPGPGSVDFLTSGTQTGISDSLGAVDAGTAVWTNDGGSTIGYGRGGTTAVTQGFISFDGVNAVVFNDPYDPTPGNPGDEGEIPGAFTGSGVLAVGGPWFGGSHSFGGSNFSTVSGADVVVQNGVSNGTGISQGEFEAIMAHELGHTLGFRHSNEAGAPNATSDALMNASLNRSSAFLSAWDSEAAAAMYGSGVVPCTAVTVGSQPQSTSIPSGSSTTLSVTASGTGPFTYQWYIGTSGTTTTPVGTNSSSLNTGVLTQTTQFWVRITNCSGGNTADSNTATVTVTCMAQITQHPQSQTVAEGGSANLSVGVGPGTYTYQWYRGQSGNTADPVGTNSPNFNTGAINAATSFWVRVTNTDCTPDASADSNTATISICQPPQIIDEPQDQQVTSGSGTTLSVNASGSNLIYQWFRGNSGVTTSPIAGAFNPTLNTGNLTQTTTYWVRVSNTCGGAQNVNSRTVTVTVAAQCTAPNITAQPQSATITSGDSATLTVTATGTSLVYKWYEGQVGDTSKQVGPNAPMFNTGVLTQTKTYWVQVSNSCGTKNSTAATVTVQGACPAGAICTLNGRFELSLAVRDHRSGVTGTGTPLQQNDIFGYYSLPAFTGDPTNPEVFVKVLDGRPINGNFWTFFGGLTDLEYTLSVKDTQTGQTKTYFKQGGSSAGGFDVGSGPTPETCAGEIDGTVLANENPTVCANQSDRLCLVNSRFRIQLTARDQRTGGTGAGQSIPQGNIFGYFSIPALTGNPSNPEVFVKVVDARSFNGFFWVFFSGLTDLEYTMTVTDTFTGKRKSYTKAPGSACGAFDTNAFTGQ